MRRYGFVTVVGGLAVGIGLAAYANLHLNTLTPVEAQSRQSEGGIGPEVPSPADWIPFSASVRRSEEKDGVRTIVMEGHQYRNSDGSTRLETGPAGGPIAVISIRNIATNRYYLFMDNKWRSFPMRPPAGGVRPGKRRADMKGLSQQSEVLNGLLVYRYQDPQGVESLIAPDINFFPVRISFNGTLQELFDLQTGEQSRDLFEVPPGAAVEERTEFAGIVSFPRSAKGKEEQDPTVWIPSRDKQKKP
jgi:hypothetical protein